MIIHFIIHKREQDRDNCDNFVNIFSSSPYSESDADAGPVFATAASTHLRHDQRSLRQRSGPVA